MLHPKIRRLVNKICDVNLRKKVAELLENPTFELDGKKYSGLPLDVSPAGLSHHHCYPGGFVEHIASTANIALAMCNSIEKIYHGKVNRDVVLAGVLLHDIFKPATYSINENGSYSSTSLAEYMDHLSLVISELVRRDFPLEVVHAVSAHHGDYGPIHPHTIEALVCHLADLMDSRMNGEVLNAAAYLARRAVDGELPQLNSKESFEILYSKQAEGWSGVTKAVEKIRRRKLTHKA